MPVILQVPPVFRRFVYPWITPAHAGKTSTPALTGFPLRDHPRACGENVSPSSRFLGLPGSPPRMRGKLREGSEKNRSQGITPAHAGKTSSQCQTLAPCRDHPRACGENLDSLHEQAEAEGSPPRMRGKPPTPQEVPCKFGSPPRMRGKRSSLLFYEM